MHAASSPLLSPLQVSVAEFNSKPVVCSVTGSSLPGISKESILREAAGSGNPDMVSEGQTLRQSEAHSPVFGWVTVLGGGEGGEGGRG